MPAEPRRKWTRRGFVALGLGGVTALGAAAGWRRWRSLGSLRHVPARGTSLAPGTRRTVAHFIGTHFGARLSGDDLEDLSARLDFAVENDGGWLAEYEWLAAHVDALAREAGQESFVDASADVREAVMRAASGTAVPGRRQRLQAFLHADGRKLLRMRRSTLPQLHHLYRNSGVPWRQRGYTSWPGMPDDRLAYTRPLETYRC